MEEEEWDAETQEGLGTAFGKGESKKKEKVKRARTGEVAATVAARGLVTGGTASVAQRREEREVADDLIRLAAETERCPARVSGIGLGERLQHPNLQIRFEIWLRHTTQ